MKTIEENIEAAKLYISEAAKAELWEEGRQMERHELLRWRDPKDENPTERGGLCIAKFITGEYEIVRYRDGRYMGLRPHYDNPRQVIVNGISVTSYDLRTADYTDVVMGWRPIKEEDGEEQKRRSIKTLKKLWEEYQKGLNLTMGDLESIFMTGAQASQEWISVDDELPQEDEAVLVKTKNGKYTISQMYILTDHWGIVLKKKWKGSYSFAESITHWRPIEYK